MPRYTIKSNVAFSGKDTIVVDVDQEFKVGDPVTISPKQTMVVSSPDGGSVTLTPGVSFTGTVTEKE